jgi:hypothetical protein
MAYKGSCLCKAVLYEVESFSTDIAHCHCQTCQKAHASPFTTVVGVSRDDFHWINGEEMIRSFESSPGKNRLFCSQCGTHIVADRLSLPHMALRVATLDDTPAIAPAFHVWTSHDRSSLVEKSAIPRYLEWQPSC